MANALLETKLIASGDSASIELPEEVMSEMGLKINDKVLLVKNGKGYTLLPYDETLQKQMEAAKEGMQNYRNALRELAK